MKRETNGRRRFLGACLALVAAPVAANCLPGTRDAAHHGLHLLHLRHEVAEIGSGGAYLRLRANLATGALDPWLRSWMESLDGELPYRFEALVEVEQHSEKTRFGALLDFSEWFEAEPDLPSLGFVDWLTRFHPQGRDDFLMALPLYNIYRDTGDILPSIRPTPDAWLDAMLGSTRGMLFWKQQYIDLVHLGAGVDHGRARRLIQDFVKRLPGAHSALRQIPYAATGQDMMQIITDRRPGVGVYGSPDYLAGDWLQRHWTTKPERAISLGRKMHGSELSQYAQRL